MWRFLVTSCLAITLMACSTPSKTGTPPVKETCDLIDVDMVQGTIKGMTLQTEPATLKRRLPCLTAENNTDRGLQYQFEDHGFLLCPDQDILVLQENFLGRPSQPGISLGKVEVSNFYGTPDREGNYNGINFQAYNRDFGSVVLLFSDRDKVKQVELHARPAGEVVPVGY
jgi:hypothetical protein